MEVLAYRVLLRPADFERSVAFYSQALGLAVYREFIGGIVFFCGGGFLELSGTAGPAPPGDKLSLWLQVRDLDESFAAAAAAGAEVVEQPVRKPWGLLEGRIRDPDGVLLVLVEVPGDHPLRRDQRP
ncbi:MAG: VOC family protein [Acidimicrobiia bacterium]